MSLAEPPVWMAMIAALTGCFFAACHHALIDFSRTRLTEWLQTRGRPDVVDDINTHRDAWISLTALGRTASNLIILVAMIQMFAPPGEVHTWVETAWAFASTALIVSIFGVAIPVSWSRYAAEPLLAASLPLLRALQFVFRPLLAMMHALDPAVRRLIGAPIQQEGDTTPLEREILDAVTEGERSGLVDQDQKGMIEAVVELQDYTADQIMTPRTDVEGIPSNASLEDVKRFVAKAGHSRVPIYEEDLDHIIGILYVKDLIGLLGSDQPFDLQSVLREPLFVPESKPVRALLTQFKEQKVHMAMVLDEYGGTAGLITIEDILEMIVGEITDEYEPTDEEEPGIEPEGDRAYRVHARVHIDDINDELNVALPEDDDYETLGGFVLATLGRVPDTGETFEYEGLRFVITQAEKTRVQEVRIEVPDRTAARMED